MKRGILLLFFPLLAFADSGTATRYLMNEPASLMDVGIIRLNSDLKTLSDLFLFPYFQATGNADISAKAGAFYDLENDKITVNLHINLSDGSKAEAGCRNVVIWGTDQIRTLIDRFLVPHGTEKSDHQKNLAEQLYKRTDVFCEVRTKDPNQTLVTVRKNLASDEVEVIEGDDE